MSRRKFGNTAAKYSSEELALLKLDQLITLLKALAEKLDNDSGVSDTDFASSLTDSVKTVTERLQNDINNILEE